jgi:hypothetical protein
VPLEGSGSHRPGIGGDVGSFTDPDGSEGEAVAAQRRAAAVFRASYGGGRLPWTRG